MGRTWREAGAGTAAGPWTAVCSVYSPFTYVSTPAPHVPAVSSWTTFLVFLSLDFWGSPGHSARRVAASESSEARLCPASWLRQQPCKGPEVGTWVVVCLDWGEWGMVGAEARRGTPSLHSCCVDCHVPMASLLCPTENLPWAGTVTPVSWKIPQIPQLSTLKPRRAAKLQILVRPLEGADLSRYRD